MSAFSFRPAAHVKHGLEHSYAFAGQLAGAAAGLLVGAALTLFGIGPLVMVPLAGIGAAIGKRVGANFSGPGGTIKDGAASCVYGPDVRPAARILDPIDCIDPAGFIALTTPIPGVPQLNDAAKLIAAASLHLNKVMNMGADNVTIELREAARLEDITTCKAKVSSAIDSIWIGGATIYLDKPSELSEDNPYFEILMKVVDIVAIFVKGGAVVLSLALEAIKIATEHVFGKDSWVAWGVSIAAALVGILAGNPKSWKDLEDTDIVELGKIGLEGEERYNKQTEVDPPLTPRMERRRQELQKQRKRTTADHVDWWAKRIANVDQPAW